MVKKVFYILFLFLFFFSELYPQWRLANGTEGFGIPDIEIYYSNPDTVYAIGNGLMLSIDRGENWDSVRTAPGYVFKIDPFDSKRIYLNNDVLPFDGNAVPMTTDGGLNWETLFVGRGPPFDAPLVEIDPVDLTTVYVTVMPHKIYRSTDRGNNWDSMPPPSGYSFSSLAIAPSNSNIIYIGCAHPTKVFKSSDRGQTWTQLPFPLTEPTIILIAVHPKNSEIVYAAVVSYGGLPGGVYKTTDGGLTWEEKNNGLTNYDWDIYTITINPKHPDEIYIGTGGDINLFRSTNGSEKWTRFDNGLPQSGHVRSIAIDTLNNRIYIGRSRGLYIFDKMTRIDNNVEEPPEDFQLHQNYPNPFNPTTKIKFEVPTSSVVAIKIYNILGREIETLLNEVKEAGTYEVNFDASKFPSGVYFYRLTSGQFSSVKKLILLK